MNGIEAAGGGAIEMCQPRGDDAQARVLEFDNPDTNDWLAVNQFTSPWMQFVARHDPRADLTQLSDIPVLALNGSLEACRAGDAGGAPRGSALTRGGSARSRPG